LRVATPHTRAELAAVCLVSTAALGIQIGWTRIFSFMIWYHFAFLVISTAMLGFSVGGLVLSLRPALLERSRAQLAFYSALGFCVASALALLGVCNLPFDAGVLDSARNFALFVLLIAVVALSFSAAGLFTAALIAHHTGSASRIYAANLLGSGLGCALAVPLLDRWLPTTTLLAFSLIGWLALPCLLPYLSRRRRAGGLALVALLGVGACFASSLDPLAAPFYLRSTKAFPNWSKERIRARLGNSLSIVDVFDAQELTGLWGLSDQRYAADTHGRALPERVGFCIDGWALTFAYRAAQGDILDEPVFDYLPASLVYGVRHPDSALVIGAGGGIDVITALRRGVRSVTAVEINPVTMTVSRALGESAGRIFERQGVRSVVAEGRAFVAASGDARWDVIQLSGVDTLAAAQAGAFTLAESYLYTREAFESYLEHLTPGGVLTLTRWMSDPPRQSLRVITLADAALRARGIEDTADHILLVTDPRRLFAVFLISLTPFSAEEARRALDTSRARGFIPLALPHVELPGPPDEHRQLLAAADKQAFVRDYPFDISATTDDEPFFFEHTRWRNAWKYPDRILERWNGHLILLATTLIVALLGAIFLLLPARHGLGTAERTPRRVLGYFACLGLGYVLVEVTLVQKLTLYLGHPAYALAIVLCGMLLFSGAGSLLSRRVRGRVLLPAAAVALALVAYRFGLDACLRATLALPFAARVALALSLLGLPASLMGMPFPSAVTALGDARRGWVVRGWVVNGYCSVLGSCLSMVLSISWGFHVVLLCGAACYALAALLWPRLH
jgi:hypothetical protein